MSDVFISYSHKDTDFVRDLVKPLEAEGFSVWWDHTIPPGRTWDDVIARGIREAKACIIVWSPNSVISDWVKEEATLAKEGGKYLPIQIAADLPPMGFRRIQAADLRSWNGNAQDPQWRLLMTEIATLVGGKDVAAPPVAPTLPVASVNTGRTRLMVGSAVGVVIAVGAVVGWGFWHASKVAAVAAEAPPSVAATLPTSDPQAATALAAEALAAAQRVAAAAPAANVEPTAAAQGSVVGVWQGWYHLDTDPPNQRTPLTGTFQADGTVIGQSGGQTSLWRWQQSGSSAQWTNGNTTYTAAVTGNHMVGTISYGQHSGNFEANR
ncbi:MAG TPA: toll/interleukin-1 receptor domain-containing protein [Steroidobacteraceae bacterium]|nr:toll/interleukin-1 receptor domain-containing protein [Steroidobacteraceae bacterium]